MPRLTSRGFDFDRTRGDLWYFELEQALDETGMAAAHHDLRSLGGFADFDDVRLQPGTMLIALIGDLLGLGQQRLHLAQVEERVPVVGLLHNSGDNVAFPTGVLHIFEVALHFPDALQNDLLGGLGRDPPKVFRSVIPLADDVAVFVQFLTVDADFSRLRINGDHRFLGGVRSALVCRYQRIRQGVEKRLDRNPLIAGDLTERIEELEVRLAHGVVTCFLFSVVFVVVLAAPDLPPPEGGVGPHAKTVRARSMSE